MIGENPSRIYITSDEKKNDFRLPKCGKRNIHAAYDKDVLYKMHYGT